MDIKNKTILVTGGAGYIGSHVVKLLCDEAYDVIIIDNSSTGFYELVDSRATLHKGDIDDKKFLETIFTKYNIDTVIHFAAKIDVTESVKNPSKYYKNNFIITKGLLNSMIAHNIYNFIFSSTAAVYGNGVSHRGIKENDPLLPLNPYGESKLMVEFMIRSYARAHGLRYTILRYFNVGGYAWGLRDLKKSRTHIFARLFDTINGKLDSFTVLGTDHPTRDGTCIRSYIHIKDLARAHILVLSSGMKNSVYNVGTPEGTTVLEVIDAVEKVTKKKIPVIYGPRRDGDPSISYTDISKIQNELGFFPEYDILDIARDMWEEEKKN